MVEKLRSDLPVMFRSTEAIGASIIPEKHIPRRKKVILNHLQRRHQEKIRFQIKIKHVVD